jgi:hypothetical protein
MLLELSKGKVGRMMKMSYTRSQFLWKRQRADWFIGNVRGLYMAGRQAGRHLCVNDYPTFSFSGPPEEYCDVTCKTTGSQWTHQLNDTSQRDGTMPGCLLVSPLPSGRVVSRHSIGKRTRDVPSSSKGNGKVVLHEDVWRSGCIDPLFLDLGTSCRWVVSFTPRLLYPRYPLDRRLGGPQSQSRCRRCGEEKIFYPTGTWTLAPRSSSP